MEINKKLKEIYFFWGDECYDGPFPRSLIDTFDHYLFFSYYDLNTKWLEKIIKECGLVNEQEFKEQIVLIEIAYNEHSEELAQERELKVKQEWSLYLDQCLAEGVLPF